MKKHINIPIFIPHLGCPNQCVFCNQRTISGVKEFNPDSVRDIVEDHLKTSDCGADTEIAFFGGSFTGIDRGLMTVLLDIAYEYVKSGAVSSVRCSTRPDYIDSEILALLKSKGVGTIELGLQSTDSGVLSACKRGHSIEDEEKACRLILENGFTLGAQMMIGLPASTPENELKTAEFIVKSGAKEARIYPTVVFRETELCSMTENGVYTPLSIEDAVERSASVLKLLNEGGVRVLRIGLCDSENLHSQQTFFAGPNHAALGELVENRLYLKLIEQRLTPSDNLHDKICVITAPKGHTSKVIGQGRSNKILLIKNFGFKDVKVKESDALSGYNILLDIQERKQNVLKVT